MLDDVECFNKFTSQNGRTSLYWASSRGHTAVVKMLIENNADINICQKVNKLFSCKMRACYVCSAASGNSPKSMTSVEACIIQTMIMMISNSSKCVYLNSILNLLFIITVIEREIFLHLTPDAWDGILIP